MLTDFIFGLIYVLLMVIMLFAVMNICPKWGFSLAAKEIKEAMKSYPEPSRARKIICAAIIALLMAVFFAMMIYAGTDGKNNGFTFVRMWLRFMIIMYTEKAFDLFCLDYLWVKKSGWFGRNFPQINDCGALKNFKVFRREQIVRLISFPFICAVLAWIFLI